MIQTCGATGRLSESRLRQSPRRKIPFLGAGRNPHVRCWALGVATFPSLVKEGWTRHQENIAEGILGEARPGWSHKSGAGHGGRSTFPSLVKERWLRHEENAAKPPLTAQTGVVGSISKQIPAVA